MSDLGNKAIMAENIKYFILETAVKRHYLTPKIIRNIRKTLILRDF